MVKKLNNRGWLRIVEAVIGILILASVLLLVYSQNRDGANVSDYVYDLQKRILKDISLSTDYRTEILEGEGTNVKKFVSENIPQSFEFELVICNAEDTCNMENFIQTDVYAEEILISSTLDYYSPKKVRLFVWENI